MVRHGRKTEEREHVFSNQSVLKNNKGAWDLKILCLSFFVMLVFFPTVIKAQPTPLYNAPRAGVADDAVARMEIRLQEMERQMRDLTGRIEEQSYEINRLKSQNKILEEKAASVAVQQQAAQELTQPLKLDLNPPQPTGMKTIVPGGGALKTTSQYEQAFSYLKSNQYEEAQKEFQIFLDETPDHSLAPNAKYWLGESYYAQGDYKTAARTFAEGFQAFPNSSKSPDILLKLGMSLAQMGKKGDACVALSQLPVKFPAGPEGVLQRGEIEREKLECES